LKIDNSDYEKAHASLKCDHSNQWNLPTDFNSLCVVSRFIQVR